MAVLELRDLVKHYGDHHAVGPVSFAVEEGEFLSLLGPSGCGKTTTLRCIAGFETPTGGDILMDGRSIVERPPNHRDIGLVFQNYALFPHLTVFDNVAFGLALRRRPRREITERVGDVLALVEMAGFEARYPGQLSGGQQQRVAIARSLALQPRLLLLDEPLSNLDLKLRVQMRAELRKLQRRLRKTTIYVTHDQSEALALSDRIAVLSQGRVEQIGAPAEVYESPRTPFVADFIGSSNLVRGVAEARPDGGCLVRAGNLTIRSAQGLPDGIGQGQEVIVLLRPERLRLRALDDPGVTGWNAFPATIVDVTYLGQDLQFIVELQGGLTLLANLKAGGADKELAPNDTVVACIAPRDVRLLAAAEPR